MKKFQKFNFQNKTKNGKKSKTIEFLHFKLEFIRFPRRKDLHIPSRLPCFTFQMT